MFFQASEDACYILTDPQIQMQYPHETGITLTLGGQASTFEADICVYRETVLQAAETFAMRGERDARLRWIKDS